MNVRIVLSVIFSLSVLPVLHVSAQTEVAKLTFEKNIRPIFKANCFQCHGEEKELEGGLDLRLRRWLVKGGESGAALVPGKASESLLLERVQSGDMPPGDMKLTSEEISLIRRWIEQGAITARPEPKSLSVDGFTEDERNFWSFLPIKRSAVPAVKAMHRVRTPIDAFVLAKLEEQGLTLSPDAKKQTLLRRAYFDLTGLPPAPAEVEQFMNDKSPNAYELLIDRLLDSPRYGERWGRHWLDVAGYADSEGYTEADKERTSAFRYRDYVIQSFNADMPFDQFIVEQLAGDELVKPPYKNMTAESIEKLTATSFLRMAPDGTGTAGIDENVARNQVMAETLKIVSTSLMGMTVGCAECHSHRYDPILHTDYYRLRAIFEPAINWKQWRVPTARRISLYTDEDRKQSAEIEAEAAKIDAERKVKAKVFIDITLADQLLSLPEEVREPLSVAYKTVAKDRTPEQTALLNDYPKILKISEGSLYLYDREIRTNAAKVDAERTKLQKSNPEAKEQIAALKKKADDIRATQKADKLKEYVDRATEIRATKKKEGFIRALTEIPGKVPETFLFYRGDFEQPKEKLLPAGLSVINGKELPKIPDKVESLPSSGRRLAFARRLTSDAYPLTARVLVNRFWMQHSGKGIVETPGDFGLLGAKPTHPELLDWLADEFRSSGWKLKKFHKLIMLSTVYRQSSSRYEKLDSADPENQLYGRMSVRRLESEAIRDSILAISGKLNLKMYGEPIPVMEDDVGQIIIGKENLDGERKPGAVISLDGDEFRRSLYIQVRRSRPLAVLDAFDAPIMEPNCSARTTSTVAPQALMLMNSHFSREFAEYFAARIVEEGHAGPAAQITRAWLLAYGSNIEPAELESAKLFIEKQTEHYKANPPANNKTTPQQLALSSLCQALIGSNEFLYVD